MFSEDTDLLASAKNQVGKQHVIVIVDKSDRS